MNYYELFGIDPRPVADHTLVQKKYISLQKKYHPDFIGNDEESQQISADINKGFSTFKDRDRSIEYFLRHNGVVQDDDKQSLPNDFLMEMMDLNEAVDDGNAEEARKMATDFLDQLDLSVQEDLAAETSTAEQLTRLKDYYYKRKYLQRILERLPD